ncbi:MAG TPA: NAD-dependent dehydratase [Chloroflexi bacterium]|nr:NAD-dependent dehydratase [Chloroflexota bacterium]HCU98733.1 NAD-dependent dehydratase [Chloroflexota bacterium]
MHILITGGAGFIGSHLCDRLLEDGHNVVVLDNLVTGSLDNIAHITQDKNFRFINQNVAEYIDLQDPVDAVMHFASPASPSQTAPNGYLQLPIQTLKAGALGTLNALGVAKKYNSIFMLASTSEVYGDPLVHPQTEDYWGNVNPIGPRSVYDEAKRFAEALTMAYHRTHNVKTRIVRIFNTYGPRMAIDDGRVVPNFICQALRNDPLTIYGDGSQTRSFCYVSDLIDGIILLLNSDITSPTNIGNPHEITILEFAQTINRLINNPAGTILENNRTQGDPEQRKPNITKANQMLSWHPKVKLEKGLAETISFFKNQLDD